ncbi:MAG TPA: hypothetical protein DDW49_10315 [Deltaproteobacteria bacterium]|nr:MAG: hypothetical protein A2048_08095 [Deltaproteobacteria bacterium GWA2_45_12]HBF13756.1 hypothetical protein [Deltaproteobacteria bacterium]
MKQFFAVLLCLVLLPSFASADSTFIYRNRANWVKIDKASPKKVPLGHIMHPANITEEQMEAMLTSVKIAKRYVLKKEVYSADVFDSWEARKFASYIVQALGQADADHVVNFSIIHKRPTFILRNDFISMGNIWVSEDGMHIQFDKLFAKITGDYEASANMDKLIREAKTARVTLEAQEGQMLAYDNAQELVLNPTYDFVAKAQLVRQQRRQEEEAYLRSGSKKKIKHEQDIGVSESTASVAEKSVAERLKELDQLKAQKLVTEAEYQQLRKKILQDI